MASYNSIIYIMIIVSYYNLCEAQNVTWIRNNFKTCIKIGIDNFTMEAAIKKTTKGSLIAKSALFEIKSSNVTINSCSVRFDKCGNTANECYCAKNTSDELIIVYRIKSNISLIGNVVSVKVPCADPEKEETLASEELVITQLNDTTPVLKINKQEYDLSKEFVYCKVPAEIEFCCDKSFTICKAHIERNNEKLDKGSYCVYFNETSKRYSNYKMYSTLCNRIIKNADMMFFPEISTVELVHGNCVELWEVCLIGALESIGAIVIAFGAYKGLDKCFFKKKNPEKKNSKSETRMEEINVNSDGMANRRKQLKQLLPDEDIEVDVNPRNIV